MHANKDLKCRCCGSKNFNYVSEDLVICLKCSSLNSTKDNVLINSRHNWNSSYHLKTSQSEKQFDQR